MVNPRPPCISISSRSKESLTTATSSDLNSSLNSNTSDKCPIHCPTTASDSSHFFWGQPRLWHQLYCKTMHKYSKNQSRHCRRCTLALSHSHSLSPMRSYQGSITSGKVEHYKNTHSLCWAPRLLNKHRQRSPEPMSQTNSLYLFQWGSEREWEFKGGKGKPCVSNFRNQFFKLSAVCWRQTFGTWFPWCDTIFFLTADWLDKR